MINLDRAAGAVDELLSALDVPRDDNTTDTPVRVAESWAEALAGYEEDPAKHLSVSFPAGESSSLVVVSGVRVTSTCAHHLAPIDGTATVAYRPAPAQSIVGLSKLARLLHGYAQRLQLQERLGSEVTTALQRTLSPQGAGCLITATHGCMVRRGINEHGSVTTTHSWSGEWEEGHPDAIAVRAEHERG